MPPALELQIAPVGRNGSAVELEVTGGLSTVAALARE